MVSQLWSGILAKYDNHPPFKRVSTYGLWQKRSSHHWKLNADPSIFARLLLQKATTKGALAENSPPISIFDIDPEPDYEMFAFGFPTILNRWVGRIREVTMDSACKSIFFAVLRSTVSHLSCIAREMRRRRLGALWHSWRDARLGYCARLHLHSQDQQAEATPKLEGAASCSVAAPLQNQVWAESPGNSHRSRLLGDKCHGADVAGCRSSTLLLAFQSENQEAARNYCLTACEIQRRSCPTGFSVH